MTTTSLASRRREFLGIDRVNMKPIALSLFATLMLTAPVTAQQASDPVAATYAQLLSEANSRVVGLSAEIAKDKATIADLQKQLELAKPKVEPTP